MLVNNSLPVVDGKMTRTEGSCRHREQEMYSRKLVVDKRILLNLLTDLQRFRKLLNLKKRFYIFNVTYDGKPTDMAKWHKKVEVRVTQTFRQLNIRRLIDIIGYDPSLYFKGSMSYANIESVRRNGKMEQPDKVASPVINYPTAPEPTSGVPRSESIAKQLRKVEGIYRHENLSQNLGQLVSSYDIASLQLRNLVDIFRRLNISRNHPTVPPPMSPNFQARQPGLTSLSPRQVFGKNGSDRFT